MSEYFDETALNPEDLCENCEGKTTSSCCGAYILNGDICYECKEHCDTQCEYCEFNTNNNIKTL